MDTYAFKEGQEVDAIYFSSGENFVAGTAGVERITVVNEGGQMIEVPWFAIWRDGKIDTKWNSALIEGVSLL